jgi:hypothetical protein
MSLVSLERLLINPADHATRQYSHLALPKNCPSSQVNLKPKARNNYLSAPFELALVLVRFNHVARFIVNAHHSIM